MKLLRTSLLVVLGLSFLCSCGSSKKSWNIKDFDGFWALSGFTVDGQDIDMEDFSDELQTSSSLILYFKDAQFLPFSSAGQGTEETKQLVDVEVNGKILKVKSTGEDIFDVKNLTPTLMKIGVNKGLLRSYSSFSEVGLDSINFKNIPQSTANYLMKENKAYNLLVPGADVPSVSIESDTDKNTDTNTDDDKVVDSEEEGYDYKRGGLYNESLLDEDDIDYNQLINNLLDNM